MNYRTNIVNGDELSALGFGCMRFPKDEGETERLILHAIDNGVNYFDTAYIYPNSEATLGRILSKHNKRGDVKIATKIPPYFIKKYDDLESFFNKQLTRLQTDYIDYYLVHMLTDAGVWERLLGLGIEKWITQKKAENKIKNIGFSYHGGQEEFIKICDVRRWDFCLIQYNYLDENNLAGRHGLAHAAQTMPVMIMEPLRGGVLANNLPKSAMEALGQAGAARTPAEWALRWLWDQPEPTCVLSGMNSMEMLNENIKTASAASAGDFAESDYAAIAKAKAALAESIKVPCTACGYCMPCPQGVDIPTCFFCYNDTAIMGKAKALTNYMSQTSFKSKPQMASLCNGCGICEKKCPQKIEIRKELQNTVKAFEKFYFKPAMFFVRRMMRL
ncbi:MAG: aldo/keto reductase [Oscillospiraceae bacterium]|nr:aldo/keto reductase [Oscillospiraceae bacterium]